MDILRIKIPYKDIYTSVFLIRTPQGDVIFDTAATDEDVEKYILPIIKEKNYNVKYLFISHKHTDHAGGVARILREFPNLLQNELPKEMMKIPLSGHTEDSVAIFDARSKTLITGDGLQLYGIYGSGKWGASINYVSEHLEALEKLEKLDIENILMSHDYHPVGNCAVGKEKVRACISECRNALFAIRDEIIKNPDLSDEEIANAYNEKSKLPIVGHWVAQGVRRAINENKI